MLAKSADSARARENAGAAALAASPRWPADDDALLARLAGADGSETVAMCGGDDECARVWMGMAPPTPAAGSKATEGGAGGEAR